ncbi:MAG: serine hydroxymethyltransferase [Minisyncoccales bacterium]
MKNKDIVLEKIIKKEERRQRETINLIASENYPSKEVRNALSSLFISKYSEGRPKKRYYAGIKNIDQLELLAEKRTREVFKLNSFWEINVQPYSGAIANYAILRGLLKPGEKIMTLALDQGGHLSHGHSVNLSGKDFQVVHYFLNPKTLLLDYKEIEKKAKKEKPRLIIAGYTSYPRKVNFKIFSQIAKKVNSYLLADISHIAGLIVGGIHPNPFPWADVVMTTTHKTLRGPRGAIIICKKELKEKIFRTVFPGLQGGPHNHTIAGLCVCLFEAKTKKFKKYIQQVVKNAKTLAQELKNYGFDLVTNGTDNHLLLLDLRKKKISGTFAQEILEKAGIIVNKNALPYDQANFFNPSGLRLGTPAITSRGMKEKEMKKIAFWIYQIIENPKKALKIKKEVKKFALSFKID